MRRQTDFVLEKAGWPALLLEENGAICRANQAACQLFGPSVQGVASLTALLDDANGVKPDRFLADLAAGKPGELQLNVHGGKKTRFLTRVTKLSRDGQNYFVLQLFDGPPAPFADTALWARANDAGGAPSSLLEAVEVPFALTNADWPALVVDKAGTIIRANPSANKVFGAAARKGAALGVFWQPENTPPLEKFLTEIAHGRSHLVKLRAESGNILPFHAQVCPAAQSKWVLLQFFMENGQVTAAAALAPPKAEDDFLLRDADWPAFVVRKNGQVARANRAAVRAFGSSVENPEVKLSAIWSSQNKESLDQFLSLPSPAAPPRVKFRLKSGLPAVFLVSCLASEDDFLLQLFKDPSPVSGETPAGIPPPASAPAAAAHPASSAESNAAQRQKLDCALQLARSVALDFNNALTSILGHASLLLTQAEPDHPWRGSLTQIEKSASKAAEVASDLASFSLQEKDARAQTAGNLNTLLERTLEAMQNSLPRSITFTRQLERKLFTVNFDEAKMQQALVRILENAVEAVKTDGRITVETRNLELTQPTQDRTAKLNAGNYVCVEVTDNGGGIPPEVVPHLFEPFFTTKGSKHRGLGLAWVYGIVTNHGGGVAVSSETGRGASVRLYLPANDKIVRDAPLALADLRGSQTILVVDDEDLMLTMAQMVLSSFGYTVLTANSGAKALELFSHWKDSIDLAMVDLVMPNMSGRELTEQIRHLAPRLRIIWCSGYVRSSQAVNEIPYLQKPFTSQDLLRAVKRALADSFEAGLQDEPEEPDPAPASKPA